MITEMHIKRTKVYENRGRAIKLNKDLTETRISLKLIPTTSTGKNYESKKMKTTLKDIKNDATYDDKLDHDVYKDLIQWYCYHEAKQEYNKLVTLLRENWVATEDFETADSLIATAQDNAWQINDWDELELKINNESTGIFDEDNPDHYDRTATYLKRTIGSIVGLMEDYVKEPNVINAILK